MNIHISKETSTECSWQLFSESQNRDHPKCPATGQRCQLRDCDHEKESAVAVWTRINLKGITGTHETQEHSHRGPIPRKLQKQIGCS